MSVTETYFTAEETAELEQLCDDVIEYTSKLTPNSTMSVTETYKLDAYSFFSDPCEFADMFNYSVRKIEQIPIDRLLVTQRFVDEAANTKYEDYHYRNDTYRKCERDLKQR